jgi:hypothetical protein
MMTSANAGVARVIKLTAVARNAVRRFVMS